MLAVVQDHELLLAAQRRGELADQIRTAPRLDAHGLSQLHHHERLIPDWFQVNEHCGTSAALDISRRALEGKARLADARRPGKGDQPGPGIGQHPGHGGQFAVPAYKQVGGRRQATER